MLAMVTGVAVTVIGRLADARTVVDAGLMATMACAIESDPFSHVQLFDHVPEAGAIWYSSSWCVPIAPPGVCPAVGVQIPDRQLNME